MLTPILITLAVGYLLGSLPFGYLVARAKGVNIFEVGSKNPGATNVRRVLGHGPGNLVLFLDALKGAAATGGPLLAKGLAGANCPFDRAQIEILMVTGLVAAILGHSFSCFTRFKGGKSVATGAGGFLVLFPAGGGIALAIFLVIIGLTRYISLGSMIGAASLPITAVLMQRSTVLISVSAVVALFVILRHRANISRLLAGTESKIGRKAAASAAPKS
ncbi:MAG: glycerol-3-phosphate 1-O-acyltransferase PlsY [Verrucomicrobiota bacterium]